MKTESTSNSSTTLMNSPVTTTLYYRGGGSDKVYQVAIENFGDGYRVTAAWGRRGAVFQTAAKSPDGIALSQAQQVANKLIAAKTAKGYTPGEEGNPYSSPNYEDRDTGIRCQLLNPVAEQEVEALLKDARFVLQEKFDGIRLLLWKTGKHVIGMNRRGLEVGVPEAIRQAALASPFDFLVDGEAVGEVMHVFDLLEFQGNDFRLQPYLERYLDYLRFFEHDAALQHVPTAETLEERREMFAALRQRGAEGVVFKDRYAEYTEGRPASGGSQLKFKFVTTASFIVAGINAKRSVALALVDDGVQKPAGNVTIPPNQDVPAVGEVIEVRYLYAFRESGCIYQPVYRRQREDLEPVDCKVAQLKFKEEIKATC